MAIDVVASLAHMVFQVCPGAPVHRIEPGRFLVIPPPSLLDQISGRDEHVALGLVRPEDGRGRGMGLERKAPHPPVTLSTRTKYRVTTGGRKRPKPP